MNNDNFALVKDKKSNIIKLTPKIGRNDPCHCGSGKKYKNCCMKKDEENKYIKNKLEQPMLISDEYFSVKEYIELSGYPLINFDMFLLEILNIAGNTLHVFNKNSDFISKEILKKLYHYAKGFLNTCTNCEHGCIKVPKKGASFKSLLEKGANIEILPIVLQKETHLNFFYIEFINSLANFLKGELSKEIAQELSVEISVSIYWSIIDSVSDNCYKECDNRCIINFYNNAYCKFCCFGSKRLPCPKEGKVSYDVIKASEDDMEH